MKISIIIPVFNVADYLESCINSCLDQSMAGDDYEIILIDDGSEDRGPAICNEFANNYENILFYRQKHSGQSIARNVGMEKARGQFIWFVDADDRIRPNVLDHLFMETSNNNLDMLAFRGAEIIDEKPVALSRHNQLAHELMAGKDYLYYDYSSGVPLYVFRREFLNNTRIRFMEGVYHEDADFMIRALYQCNRLGFLHMILYEITIRQGSIMRSVNPKKAYDLIRISKSLSKYVNDQVISEYKQIFHSRISILINSALLNAARMNKEELSAFLQILHLQGNLFKHMRKSGNIKYCMEGWLYFLFPRQFIFMFKIAKKLPFFN